ncbi:MAG: glycosyltransferase [Bacteroidales bacterium]|nr:glycosyltransferase [Bacteroidales bacterium]
MKVLLVSTSDRKGGAAIACYRIFQALKKNGVEVDMLVRDKISIDKDIYSLNTNVYKKIRNFITFCMERICILFYRKLKRKQLFEMSFDNFGAFNLLTHKKIQEADIINFHWTSQGLLSINQIEKLLEQNKRLIFTMHDMHYFTGVCHYVQDCKNYLWGCGNCHFFSNGKKTNDISKQLFLKKQNIKSRESIRYITCSNWLKDTAKKSQMLKNAKIYSIPNPINTDTFRPLDKQKAKQKFSLTNKKTILFGAAKFSDKRKGFEYLIEALKIIHKKNKENNNIQLLIFGQGESQLLEKLPFDYKLAGYISGEDKLAWLYSAADVFVTPSLEDNLPNTVMEALSCAVPCVAFDTGGLSQMIDHNQNGYLAQLKNSEDLAAGILQVLNSDNYITMCHNARSKVENNFSEPVIAMKYNEIFRTMSI